MSAVARRLTSPASLQDLLALPEEERYELIAGELVEKDATSRHGRAQMKVGESLGPFHRWSGGLPDRPGGWWFAGETLIDFGPDHVYRPDVAGWRRSERVPELPEGVPVQVLPDWVCEIVSPSKPAHDLVTKKRVYHLCKVPHYWIIDPRDETLAVHRWTQDGYVNVLAAQRGEKVRAEPFDLVEIPVGVFFGDDED